MIGKRVYFQGGDDPLLKLEPGDYGCDGDGLWFVCTPNGMLGCVQKHERIEHEDGTVTFSPSILVTDYSGKTYHGFLEKGIWRTV